MQSLSNKVALITGSTRGIGKAIAERYAALGADIVVNYSRDKIGAEETVSCIAAMGVSVIAVQADVRSVNETERLFAVAKARFGKIDIVVVNAGIGIDHVPVTAFTEEEFDKLFSVNTKGAYFTMQHAAREIADKGRIIYIVPGITSFPIPGMAVYGGTKAVPRYLVNVLSKEIGPRGVTVNSIVPYAVNYVGMFGEQGSHPELRKQLVENNPMGRMAEVEDVADVAEFFASELSSFVSGQHLLVNGGAAF